MKKHLDWKRVGWTMISPFYGLFWVAGLFVEIIADILLKLFRFFYHNGEDKKQ